MPALPSPRRITQWRITSGIAAIEEHTVHYAQARTYVMCIYARIRSVDHVVRDLLPGSRRNACSKRSYLANHPRPTPCSKWKRKWDEALKRKFPLLPPVVFLVVVFFFLPRLRKPRLVSFLHLFEFIRRKLRNRVGKTFWRKKKGKSLGWWIIRCYVSKIKEM